MSLRALLWAYLLGGITLLPLLGCAAIAFIYWSAEKVDHDPTQRTVPKPDEEAATAKAKELKEAKVTLSGWLTVRRTFDALPNTNETYAGAIAAGYRSFMDHRSKDPRRARQKDHFFAVLKRSLLFLYEADPAIETPQKPVECVAAIQLSQYSVNVFPENLIDGELFMRRNAVCLKPQTDNADAQIREPAEEGTTDNLDAALPAPWFLFPRTNVEKEDWLHCLIHASKISDPAYLANHARDRSLFDPLDMSRLVDGIDRQADPIPTRWLNAMLGRLFLSVYRTAALENYIIGRIVRKLNRVNKPSFLSEIVVREVNVGSGCPFFSKPMLKELTAEGDASMEASMLYKGNFRITIETVATINLGSRFKPYSVRLVLAVVLKELEGTMLFRIKRPPSCRLWFGFTAMPRLVLSIEPIVSTRQIKWSMILKPIESRIREIVAESVVLPNLDDISFFDTRKYSHRGGIWGEALRQAAALDPMDLHESESEDDVLIDGGSMAELGSKADAIGESKLRQRLVPERKDSDVHSVASAPATSGAEEPSGLAATSAFSLSSWTQGDRAHSKKRSWFSTSSKTTSEDGSPAASPSGRRSPLPDAPSSPLPEAPEWDSNTAASRLRTMLETDAKGRETKTDLLAPAISPVKRSNSAPPEQAGPVESNDSDSASRKFDPLSSDPSVAHDSQARSRAPSILSTASSTSFSAIPETGGPDEANDLNGSAIHGGSETKSVGDLEDSTATLPPAEKPKLPERPAVPAARPVPLPPPKRRDPSPDSSHGSANQSTTATIMAAWRNKQERQQALAAGVTQARDTVNRWRANLGAMRKTGLEGEAGHTAEHESSSSGSPNLSRQTSQTDFSDGSGSPRGRSVSMNKAGSFFAPAPSGPTTSVTGGFDSPSGERRLSGSKLPTTTASYSAAPCMAIPQILPGHRGGLGSDSIPGMGASAPKLTAAREVTRSPSPMGTDPERTPPKVPPRKLPEADS